ncbi:MAG: T9SS type A sorting domain-containing protein [Saprospirales bacterium]|nr:T9SS type A sorting domain-containing protein [Saprospirales bacterium]
MTIKPLLVPMLAAALLALANFSPPPSGPCDSPLVGGHTGAPGETSCTGCHGGTANTGPGSLTLTLSDTTLLYSPGETFDATVVMKQVGRDKFGFVGLALKDAGNTTVGTFTIDDAVRTRTFSDGPRKYVSHTPCGADATPPDSLSWTFHWKAPATNVGNITLYLAGLAANHNHVLSGDDTYNLTMHLVPDTILLGAKELVAANRLRLWPNPATDGVFFAIEGINDGQTTHEAEIWSADGRLLRRMALAQNKLSVADLEAGVYRLRVMAEDGTVLGHASFVKQ